MTPLHELDACEALARMADGRLLALDYLEALLERIARREPARRAWVSLDGDGARVAARAAQRAWQDGDAGLLCGIPVAVKDIIHVKGLPTRAGFAPFADHRAEDDAACVSRLRSAGALVLGKVETTQFAGRDPSPTVNPWDASRTASGSSSGSAAVVADRMVPVAIGTQTGGSTIRPAAYMGVVGLSPTFGRVSRYGLLPRCYSFDTIGVMARSVADAYRVLRIIAGTDPRDPTTRGRRRPVLPETPQPRAPRLVVLEDFLERAEPEVREHVAKVLARMQGAGVQIRGRRLPVSLDLVLAVHTVILGVEVAASQAALLGRYREHYGEGLLAQLDIGAAISGRTYIQAQRLRRRIRDAMQRLWRDGDLLALPAASEVAPDRRTIGPRVFQSPWTVLGWPGFTLPIGVGPSRLPIGLQLVGAPFQEGRLAGAAQWVEHLLGRMPAPKDAASP